MSAPASALAKIERRVVVVRLADAAEAVAVLSTVFALALILFPVSTPRVIVNSWEHGSWMIAMMLFAFVVDTCLYIRVAHILSARPGMVAAACLGSLPILVVGGLSLLLQRTIHYMISSDLPNLQARLGEEILAHTFLGMVSAVFLPFLIIRFAQQFRAHRRSRAQSS